MFRQCDNFKFNINEICNMTIEYEGHSEQNRRKNRKKRRVRTQPIEHDMDRI